MKTEHKQISNRDTLPLSHSYPSEEQAASGERLAEIRTCYSGGAEAGSVRSEGWEGS